MFENLSDRLQGIFSGLKSKGRLTEDDINAAMRDIRMALLAADVNFKGVKSFIANAKERCLTAEVLDSLTPAQNVVKIVLDELTALLGQTDSGLVLSSRIPNVIMLVGLQGSGKTTAAAKLAYLLKGKGHSPLLVACDVYRPAAADQLQTLGDEMGVKVYRGDGQDPVKIASEGVRFAIDNLRDVVIVDTAGRLHVDEEMMEEAANIKAAVKPDQILMVVESYPVGTIVDGKVTKVVPFGAFVELGNNVEGLVHISEMAAKHIDTPAQVVKVGQDVKVKVMDINPDRRRISLSMKAAAHDLGFEVEVDETIQAPEPRQPKKKAAAPKSEKPATEEAAE